jgi:hypothetical protein
VERAGERMRAATRRPVRTVVSKEKNAQILGGRKLIVMASQGTAFISALILLGLLLIPLSYLAYQRWVRCDGSFCFWFAH